MAAHIIELKYIAIDDLALAGGKNESLGEMYKKLTSKRVPEPIDFTKNLDVFWKFLRENEIQFKLEHLLSKLDREHYSNLQTIGKQARDTILAGKLSVSFVNKIFTAYDKLCAEGICVKEVGSIATASD
jgi:pyruvate,water dikinase